MKKDVLIVVLAAALFWGGAAAWLSRDKRFAQAAYPAYSSRNTGDNGLSLAYAYLERRSEHLGDETRRLRRITEYQEKTLLENRAVVFRIEPDLEIYTDPVDPEEVREFLEQRRAQEEKEREERKDAVAPETERETPGSRSEKAEAQQPRCEQGAKETPQETSGKSKAGCNPPKDLGEEYVVTTWGLRRKRRLLLLPGEEEWIRNGGRLILATSRTLGPLTIGQQEKKMERAKVRKVWPLWPEVSSLIPEQDQTVSGKALAWFHTVFAASEDLLLGRWSMGRGEVFLLTAPEIFSNAHIGNGDHLLLLEALAGKDRPVYFDEWAHGQRRAQGLFPALRAWGLGPALIFLLFSGGLHVWRHGARLGRPDEEPGEHRVEAIDLLDSLAYLYRRALRRSDAIALYAQAFSHAVSIRTGVRGQALQRRVMELAPDLGEWNSRRRGEDMTPSDFQRALEALNNAFRRLEDEQRR